MEPFRGFPHVLESQQFDPSTLEQLFKTAEDIRSNPTAYRDVLRGRLVALLFAQPSSRTRASFQIAAERLGASVHVEEHMAVFSSFVKGESLEDTIRMLAQYGMEYFIIRWNKEGSVARAAAIAGPEHPVINAGDGPGQHPTQALLDVYTIWREFDHDLRRPLSVCLVGDLKNGRTVHSLVYLLTKFPNVRFSFVSPACARMKPDLIAHLYEHSRAFTEYADHSLLDTVMIDNPDVLYITRPQVEYQNSDEERTELLRQYQDFVVTRAVSAVMKKDGIIMHPLPRTFELPEEIDEDPRARYIEQMGNGLLVRMALLTWIQRTMEAH